MCTEHYNKLTEGELERVALLLEEASEIVGICGKILRHGLDSYSPDDADMVTNRTLLTKEIIDTVQAISLMVKNGDIDMDNMDNLIREREEKVKKYLHHQNTEEK